MTRLARSIFGAALRATALACTLSLAAPVARAAVYPGARAPAVAIEQRLGAQLPLAAHFIEENGRAVELGDYFRSSATRAAVPVVLVLGYYHCPNLCETVMEGALQALAQTGVAPRDYRVLAISIDPAETAADAQARQRIDLQVFAQAATGGNLPVPTIGQAEPVRALERDQPGSDARPSIVLDALVGDASSIAAVARQAGFVFAASESAGDRERASRPGDAETAHRTAFAHAAGFLVVTPDGRVSRYFLGVRHDPVALRRALEAASGRSIGGLVDELVLLCAHLDPTLGRFTPDVMLGLRLGSLLLAAALGLWVWRHRRMPARGAPP